MIGSTTAVHTGNRHTAARLTAAALAVTAVAGCGSAAKDDAQGTSGPAAGQKITVDASDTACALSATRARPGKQSFVITNNGTKVTEFYVYGADDRVLAEAENIPPGLTRTLEVDLAEPGTYRTACKPGMVGDGIRADFTITG